MDRKRDYAWLVEVAVVAALLYLGVSSLPLLVTPAAADRSRVDAREASEGGRSVGEVLVDGRVVLRMRTSAGGYSPYERATQVSRRLGDAFDSGLRPEDIHTSRWGNEAVILAGDKLLVTADQDHARLNHAAPLDLADSWAGNLAGALGGRHGGHVQWNPNGNRGGSYDQGRNGGRNY